MRHSRLIALLPLLILLASCSLGAPARPRPDLPAAPTSTRQAAAAQATAAPTRPKSTSTPAPARAANTPNFSPSPTQAAVPAALERRDLAVISPANAARLELLAAFRPGPDLAVKQALFFPDDSHLVFGLAPAALDDPGTRNVPIYVWKLAAALPDQILDSGARGLSALALSPDSTSLAAAGGASLRVWDTLTWLPLPAPPEAKSASVALVYAPQGGWLAIAYSSGELSLWAPTTDGYAERWTTSAHEGGVSALAAAPDGTRLASAGLDGALRLWNAADGEEERTLSSAAGAVTALAFTPDGLSLLVYDKSGMLREWRVSDTKMEGEFQACSSGLPGCLQPAFSPDRRLVAFSDPASPDGPGVRLWDLKTRGLLARVETGPLLDPAHISTLAFSPDGRLLAVGSEDGQVELWGVTGGAFSSGAHLKVTDPGDGLNLRDRPALIGSIRSQLRKGETLTLLEGPVVAGGFSWWRILTGEGREGWIVEVPEWFEKGE